MTSLPVYTQLSRDHLGFDYKVKSKGEILKGLDDTIKALKTSFPLYEVNTTDFGAVETLANSNKILDAGDRFQKLLFKGDGIFNQNKRKKEINIKVIQKHVENVATYAFLCHLKYHIKKHDDTGKYLSPLMFFDFQRLRNNKDMKKVLKISQHAFPDVFEINGVEEGIY
tara:strand:+ start:7560 stop:8066 length:507 start_codon:yes stop_codon:yes gene_type:complete